MWTHFHDMHSGGGLKEEGKPHIFIEAPGEAAKRVFYARFGHNPDRVSCTCCGSDYSIAEYKTLKEATAFQRGLRLIKTAEGEECYLEPREPVPVGALPTPFPRFHYRETEEGVSLPAYLNTLAPGAVIYAKDIEPEERMAEVPQQGYVWV